MADRRRTTDELLGALASVRHELHALPHVVGTAVGLAGDDPVVEVYVDSHGGEVTAAVREVVEGVLGDDEVRLVAQRSLPSASD